MRCSSLLTPAPCPGSPGQPGAPPSFLPSLGRAGRSGWGWGQPERAWRFGERLPGTPPRDACQPCGGREALGGLWDGTPDHKASLGSEWGRRERRQSGRERRGRVQGPSSCQQPPVWREAHQLGWLLPARLEVVREKGTEPLPLAFPLFVVSRRAIGCCL